MDCDFTEEVSLLVDGELAPPEAARLGAHIEGCAACRQARESFLLLRRELRSYDWAPDPNVQRAALASILKAPAAPRGRFVGLFGSLAEALSVRTLRPAHVAALALLLIGTVLGLLWLKGSTGTRPSDAPALANANSGPVQAPTDGVNKPENSKAVNGQTIYHAKNAPPSRRAGANKRKSVPVRREQTQEGLRREPPRETARVGEPTLLLPPASVVAAYAAVSLRAGDDPSPRVGRHAERVERLLRSFRNARLTGGDPTLDVAEARRLSRRLLYSNIALRREAASEGDLPVEGLLDSVEPILIDISNLPDAPSPAAVGSIKERIGRRQLVGALQAQGMSVSR
jgi:hypothetical protein